MHLAHDASNNTSGPQQITSAALDDHAAAMQSTEETMQTQNKLLRESESSAARLMEMNRLLRLELEEARATVLAAYATHAPVAVDTIISPEGLFTPKGKERAEVNNKEGEDLSEVISSLRSQLSEERKLRKEYSTQLKTVSAGFQLLKRERVEAQNILKNVNGTRQALDEERENLEKLRAELTPVKAIERTEFVLNADVESNNENVQQTLRAIQAELRRVQREHETLQGKYLSLEEKFKKSKASKSRVQIPSSEPKNISHARLERHSKRSSESAKLSAATGAVISDDELVFVGSDAEDSDLFTFQVHRLGDGLKGEAHTSNVTDIPKETGASVSGQISQISRPTTAPSSQRRRLRVGEGIGGGVSHGLEQAVGRTSTARPPTSLPVVHDDHEMENSASDFASDESVSGSEEDEEFVFPERSHDILQDIVNDRGVPKDHRLDTIRHAARRAPKYTHREFREERDLRPYASGTSGSRGGSRPGSRVQSRSQTPSQSPQKEKPAFRPAGIARPHLPAELVTGATLGAAAAMLLTPMDVKVARDAGLSLVGDKNMKSLSARRKAKEGKNNTSGVGGVARRVKMTRRHV